ncbi:MAG: radical SAM protein [Pyrodictiaceae archaeon]
MKYFYHALSSLVYTRSLDFLRRLWLSPLPADHERMLRSAQGTYALYIHMPFCHKPLCPFCCFVRYPYREDLYYAYMSNLRMEVESLVSLAEGVRIAEVYIGGGTPTVNIHSLVDFIDYLRRLIGRGVKVSVEANPRDIDEESAKMLRSVGVSRLSIGIQSFQKEKLWRIGRLNHSLEDSLRAIRSSIGVFDTLNIDVVWGIPGETLEQLGLDIEAALSLGVDQITFYPLMSPPRPGSKHSVYLHPEEYKMYKLILYMSMSKGYQPATPWCMTRGRGLIDEYVVDYNSFLAAGVSGIGRLPGYVYLNTFSPEKYISLVSRRGLSAIRGVKPKPSDQLLYDALTTVFGLSYKPGLLPGHEPHRLLASLIDASISLGLISLGYIPSGQRWRMSPRSLYTLSVIQKSVYTAVNKLREWGLRTAA